MKRCVFAIIVCALPATALGWTGPTLWHMPADGAVPGGGGIFGTGAARDHRITCLDCHVERATSPISASVTFSPPLAAIGDARTYAPGQTYQVTVRLLNEVATGPCEGDNINNFAATFERTATEAAAGSLRSDSGQTPGACPLDYPMSSTGTTAMYRQCDVVFARTGQNEWRFEWTAPASGTGEVALHYGVVDGNCMMDSFGDAVRMDVLRMSEPSGAMMRGPSQRGLALAALCPVVAVVAAGACLRGRKRRTR